MEDPEEPRVVARLRAAGCVFAEDDARLLVAAATGPAALDQMVGRRAGGVPLEHVLGWAEFCGLRVTVVPGVFVPRRRTEALVVAAAEVAPTGAVVVDMCCGTGAVGLAVASRVAAVELHCADVDPVAVRCARGNVASVAGAVHEGDLFAALPVRLRGRVEVLVANVPYVPSDEIALLPAEARLHEPRAALDGGDDGLDLVRRLATGASQWLAPGGHLLVESSSHQADAAVEAFTRAGLVAGASPSDRLEVTIVWGARPS